MTNITLLPRRMSHAKIAEPRRSQRERREIDTRACPTPLGKKLGEYLNEQYSKQCTEMIPIRNYF